MKSFNSLLMRQGLIFLVLFCLAVISVSAQTTAFTYQGRLTDGAAAANGTYDFQFALFDTATGGAQQGELQTIPGVQVTNGTFTVNLDFGTSAFSGADRFLAIQVKKPSETNYTTLAPRQQLTSSPYAIQTINAAQLGGVPASQYVQTNDSRLSDARPASIINFDTATLSGILPVVSGGTGLTSSGASGNFLKSNGNGWTSAALSASDIPAGSDNYIRNTTTQQTANFNISGSGTVSGSFTASNFTANNSSSLIFDGQSSSNIGTWFRLQNSSAGGHIWQLMATGSNNGEGAGKLIFNDQTSGGTRLQLDGTGATVNGNLTATGNLTASGAVNGNLISVNSSNTLVLNGKSSSNIGTWFQLQNSSTGGHNWAFVSTGSDNGEGAGRLLLRDVTAGVNALQLDSEGATITGNLTVSGTINASFPNCKARQTSPQLFATNTAPTVRLDDSPSCSGVTFDNTNERLVIVTPGLYQITAEILFTANSNGFRWLSVGISGIGEVAFTSTNAVNGYTTGLNASALVRLNAGDRISMSALQTSGDSLFAEVFSGRSASLSVVWVGL